MTDEVISPLRRRMIKDMTIRKLAPKTQQGYIRNVKAFAAAQLPQGRLDPQRARTFYSRYKIWSVQKRSRRCSDLFNVTNSPPQIPPTCSTVFMCL